MATKKKEVKVKEKSEDLKVITESTSELQNKVSTIIERINQIQSVVTKDRELLKRVADRMGIE
tara:strand:- start:130 stop:318 length:189 start_codon:yes stop_codon:yes gene_type:complete